jgi:hypothetical protein
VALAELGVLWLALHPHVTGGYRAYYIDQSTTCLDKPVSGDYRLGRTVSFLPDDQPAARKLRVCGWDGPAGDGTHSVGTSSMLRFAPGEPAGDLVLRMMLSAVDSPDKRAQRIVLTGNGVSIGEATIPNNTQRMLEFAVPAEALDPDTGQLDLTIAFPTATEMVPRDSDTHYRAIKLLSVQLRRPDQPASEGPQDDPAALRHRAGPDGPKA